MSIDSGQIDGIAAIKYDPFGHLTRKPVIALYLRYTCVEMRRAIWEDILPNATDVFQSFL